MEFNAVIFDMDGVICHTNPFHAEAFRVFFRKRNIETSEEAFKNHLYGKANSYIFRHFLKDAYRNEDFAKLEAEKESLFRKIYQDHISPISGFPEYLSFLKQNNIKTGVATSAPRANLELIIDHLHLHGKMESFLASEDITYHKPHPEIYLTTAEKLGVHPDQCLVFEDSYSGVTAGLEAGMKVVGVLSTHTKDELPECAYYISDFKDLLDNPTIFSTLSEET